MGLKLKNMDTEKNICTHVYSRSMFEPRPRLCERCKEPEVCDACNGDSDTHMCCPVCTGVDINRTHTCIEHRNTQFISPGISTRTEPEYHCGCGQKNKLLIIGNQRHGKDSFAEILSEEFGYTFASSSQSAADIFIYDALKDKYGYTTAEECFEDRVNHRAEWYDMICDYNKDDKARLAKGILELSDCYVGMRDRDEITECMKQGLFDIIIWVDASERLPLEDVSSFNIDRSCADVIVENNGTYDEFRDKVIRLGKIICK
jgi:hypothetical protein